MLSLESAALLIVAAGLLKTVFEESHRQKETLEDDKSVPVNGVAPEVKEAIDQAVAQVLQHKDIDIAEVLRSSGADHLSATDKKDITDEMHGAVVSAGQQMVSIPDKTMIKQLERAADKSFANALLRVSQSRGILLASENPLALTRGIERVPRMKAEDSAWVQGTPIEPPTSRPWSFPTANHVVKMSWS